MTNLNNTFPAPVYSETVLAPLYEGVKQHHWKYLMKINFAHGVMLHEQKLLTLPEVREILKALQEIEKDIGSRIGSMAYTGQYEDFFFEVDTTLRQKVGMDIGGKLHMARSRNDIDHTLFRMALKDHMLEFLDTLLNLLKGLIETAERHAKTVIVAYTHGQPAQPSTWGHYLAAFIEILLRDTERLLLALQQIDLSCMGAAAITTTGFPISRERMAELLGFAAIQENSYGCIASCDGYMGVYAALQILFTDVGRFVQDLVMRTSFEVGHLHVPRAFVQISSIMPQKRNPVAVEHLRLLSSLAASRAGAFLQIMHNTPFADMNDSEGEVQGASYQTFEYGQRALRLLTELIKVIEVNEDKVRQHIDESGVAMTELADSLVRSEGISFRQGHEIASRLAEILIQEKITVSSLSFSVFKTVFLEVTGRSATVNEETFRSYLTPEHFIAVRTLPGGPAFQPLTSSLSRYSVEADKQRAVTTSYINRKKESDQILDAAVKSLLSSPSE